MAATVLRVAVSPALIPGATGVRDVFAADRTVIVDTMRAHLMQVWGPEHRRTSERDVLLVAPARVTRTTDRGVPDYGAIGLLDAGPAPGSCTGCDPHECRGGDLLQVSASVALVLLRIAGWSGLVLTCEVGLLDEDRSAGLVTGPWGCAREQWTSEPTASVIEAVGALADGSALVVVACATMTGVLPTGASPDRVAAEQLTHVLGVDLLSRSTAPGSALR